MRSTCGHNGARVLILSDRIQRGQHGTSNGQYGAGNGTHGTYADGAGLEPVVADHRVLVLR